MVCDSGCIIMLSSNPNNKGKKEEEKSKIERNKIKIKSIVCNSNTNFVTTLSKLTGLTNCFFWKIYVKSTLTLITYSSTVFTTEDMLNTLILS